MNVTPDKLMNMFEDLAEKMDINIVQDKGNFNGGACTIDNESYIVVNKSKPFVVISNDSEPSNKTDEIKSQPAKRTGTK